jgi:polygalacturonase
MRLIKYSISIPLFLINCLCISQNLDPWANLPVVQEAKFKADTFSIVNYGAINDGLTLNSISINKAITECNAKGGGVVKVPNGLWLTGPIEMKSNVNLYVDKSAILLFTKDKSQYELVESNWEGLPAVRNQSPIWGKNLENIAITGKGIIDGNGDAWRSVKKDKLTETQWKKLVASGGVVSEDGKQWFPSAQYLAGHKTEKAGVLTNGKSLNDFKDFKDFFRPNLVVLTNCNKILIDGLTFQNSAAWCLHPLMSKNVVVRNVLVKNPWYAHNGDGLDVESCSNVLIESCVFDVGDDGICIKSGRDEEGRKRGMPTENLIARNCVVYQAHGGFVIGSEMSGGVKNMFVENCTFVGSDIGLRFKTARGRGGMVENVYVRNIAMKEILGEAILFDMYYMAKDPIALAGEKREAPKVELFPVTAATPQFQNFVIENVVCNGAEKAIFVRGLPEMKIKNLKFKNLTLQANHGIEITEAAGLSFENVNIVSKNTEPVVNITNTTDVLFDGLKYPEQSNLLFHIAGEKTSNIKVVNTDKSKAKLLKKLAEGTGSKSIEIK